MSEKQKSKKSKKKLMPKDHPHLNQGRTVKFGGRSPNSNDSSLKKEQINRNRLAEKIERIAKKIATDQRSASLCREITNNAKGASWLYTELIVHKLNALWFLIEVKYCDSNKWIDVDFISDNIIKGILSIKSKADEQSPKGMAYLLMEKLAEIQNFDAQDEDRLDQLYSISAGKVLERDPMLQKRIIIEFLDKQVQHFLSSHENKKKLAPKDHPFLNEGPSVRFWGTSPNSNSSSQNSHEKDSFNTISKKEANYELLYFSMELNDLLEEYVKIHDLINKKQSSFFSFFRNTNFKQFFNISLKIKKRLEDIGVEIAEFHQKHSSSLSKPPSDYLDLLQEYTLELIKSSHHFSERQRLLYLKSEGEKISKKEYDEVTDDLKKSHDVYRNLGKLLTKKCHKLLF